MLLDRLRDTPQRALAALLLFYAAAAAAQTSADLGLVSSYAVRGAVFSASPAVQLRIDHDTQDGWYAGAFATPVTVGQRRQGQLMFYGGRAGRLSSTLSWDAGVTRTVFLRDGEWNYHEFYAGLTLRRATARIFYSPDYYTQGRTMYLDLSGAYGLADHLRLAAHAGVLHRIGVAPHAYGYEPARDRADGRVALVADVGDVTLQLGWQDVWRAPAGMHRARGAVASIDRHF